MMTNVSLVLFQNGLPDLPVVLIEPHRSRAGFGASSSAMTLTTALDERRADVVIGD
jgi:hypothetical protein